MADPAIVERLTKLKGNLKKTQEEVATLTRTASELQAQIRGLETAQVEIEKAYGGYDELAKRLQQRLDDASKVVAQRQRLMGHVVAAVTDEIDERVSEVDDGIDAQAKDVEVARKGAEQARGELDAATQDALDKEHAYVAFKAAPKALEAQVNRIQGLLDQSQAAQQRGDAAAMYFLLEEARRLAHAIEVPTGDEYRGLLTDAYDALGEARAAAGVRKTKVDQANADYAAKKASLEAAKTSRHAKILETLKAVRPPGRGAPEKPLPEVQEAGPHA
jgi:septal ring factor EnvC (AmiA/AmiB activator)